MEKGDREKLQESIESGAEKNESLFSLFRLHFNLISVSLVEIVEL